MKESLKKAEQSLGEEHFVRLRVERELKGAQRQVTDLTEKRRKMDLEHLKMSKEIEQNKTELVDLRRENRELKREQDETIFVAKSDFVMMENTLKTQIRQRDEEIERLNKLVKKIKDEVS